MNAIFNRLASFVLGAILGVALSAPALADSVIAPPAVPAGYVDYAANAAYATNAGYASSANYANGADYANSAGYAANAGNSGQSKTVLVKTVPINCGDSQVVGLTSLEYIYPTGRTVYRYGHYYTEYRTSNYIGELISVGSGGYVFTAYVPGYIC